MSAAELKYNLLRIINNINDSNTLKDIYLFVSRKQGVIPKNKKKEKGEPEDSSDLEKQQWHDLSLSNISRAYGEDEPDYTNAVIKEPNPEYHK